MNTITRRNALIGTMLLTTPAMAQARPVRIVVAFPPGGAADIVARLLAERLRATWDAPVVVENRAGAGATIPPCAADSPRWRPGPARVPRCPNPSTG